MAENSEADLVRNRAAETVGWALREFAANLLRVIRGAGRPSDLGRQAVIFVDTLQTYRGAVGDYPSSHELEAMVALERPDMTKWSRGDVERRNAEWAIVRGALQMAASALLDQRTQQTAGESELYGGVNRIGDLREAGPREGGATSAKTDLGSAAAKATRKGARVRTKTPEARGR